MNIAEGLTLGIVYAVTIVAEALGAMQIGPERTYWPVLRLQKATLAAALSWYVSVALFSATDPGVLSNFVANSGGIVLVMLNSLYCLWLVMLRNRIPAFLLIDLTGVPRARRPNLEREILDAASAARHALVNEEQVALMEAGIARYKAMTPEERRAEREKAGRALRRGRRRRTTGGID